MSKRRAVQTSLLPDLQPDKPTGKILGSVVNGTNADLMAKVAPFYLTGHVCDVTYGLGAFWRRFRPAQLAGALVLTRSEAIELYSELTPRAAVVIAGNERTKPSPEQLRRLFDQDAPDA